MLKQALAKNAIMIIVGGAMLGLVGGKGGNNFTDIVNSGVAKLQRLAIPMFRKR